MTVKAGDGRVVEPDELIGCHDRCGPTRGGARMRTRWFLAVVSTSALASCGNGDGETGPPPPEELERRSVLSPCGEFVTTQPVLTPADRDKVSCIVAAFQAGTPAELIYERPGIEGGRIKYYLHVLGPRQVEEFKGVLEDRFGPTGWSHSICSRIDFLDPFGYPFAVECQTQSS